MLIGDELYSLPTWKRVKAVNIDSSSEKGERLKLKVKFYPNIFVIEDTMSKSVQKEVMSNYFNCIDLNLNQGWSQV